MHTKISRWVLAFSNENESSHSIEMSYDPKRPFEVKFIFSGETSWVFSRDLLRDGIASDTPVGYGDIKIHALDSEVLNVRLDNPFGFIDLKFPLSPVSLFVGETYLQVNSGKEDITEDIDRILLELG
jgi:hypothetical protein